MVIKFIRLFSLITVVYSNSLVCAQEIEVDPEPIEEDSWEASPLNSNNSPHNGENTSFNFNNSPRNFANSIDNPKRLNVVNILGVVVGYAVKRSNGTVNYFDNDGKRVGYSPDGGLSQFDVDGDSTKFRVELNSD
jgi:hypothetical protein